MLQTAFFTSLSGLLLLVLGAEALVRGAAGLAARLGISPLVIGLTVVSFGTSSPELAVSIKSVLAGKADIAMGNVVGSNIFNVLFILGISAAITPLAVSLRLIRLDVPIMIAASTLFLLFGLDGSIGGFDGFILVALFGGYTVFTVRLSREKGMDKGDGSPRNHVSSAGEKAGPISLQVVLVTAGLTLLIIGAQILVKGAIGIARAFNVSELVIGLTIVAAGTSLPEVATSVLASIRGERDIAVGNVVGSNIFNILAIPGIAGMLSHGGIPLSSSALRFDVPVMIASAVACLPIFFTGQVIARWEGSMFLGYYVAYSAYLLLASAHHSSLPTFSSVMMAFIMPLTIITLIITTVRVVREKKR